MNSTGLDYFYDVAISDCYNIAIIKFNIIGNRLFCKSILVHEPQKTIDIVVNDWSYQIKMSGDSLLYRQAIITPDRDQKFIELEVVDKFFDRFWVPPVFKEVDWVRSDKEDD